MTKTEIIKETAGFYNSGNRAVRYGGNSCGYIVGDGNKCAVGRCLINPKEWECSGNAGDLFKDMRRAGLDPQEQFLEKYRGHDEDFWMDLQSFHDIEINWDENGLTQRGKRNENSLLEGYSEEIG